MSGYYQPDLGGHAPGNLREAMQEWIDEGATPMIEVDGQQHSDEWLLGQLGNCTDVMPSPYCFELDLPPGSTYAEGVRSVRLLLDD
jgi:hypothetical protein